ncbi:MAG: YceI family protein [Phycisphaeraceae bacterium]|nr:MAG: YceI family protein [Phycisphaeraceae bacterium]
MACTSGVPFSVCGLILLAGAASAAVIGLAPSTSAPALAAVAALAPAPAPAGLATFEVDGVHSSAVFKIQHAGVSPFYGTFQKISGSIAWDKDNPQSASFSVTIDANSVASGNTARDNHLKSPDFFNAKEHPTIQFKSTSLTKTGDSTFDLAGEVTMLGKTKPITAKLVFTGERDAGGNFGYRAGFDTSFTLKRSDFGMTYGVAQGSLSDEVTVMVGFAGVKK